MRSTLRWVGLLAPYAIVVVTIVGGAVLAVEAVDAPPTVAFAVGMVVAWFLDDLLEG